MLGVVRDKDDFLKRLRFELRVCEKQNGTTRLAQQSSRDISQKRMKRALFFQGAGHDKIDIVLGDGSQNASCRIALTIMNRRIAGQMQATKNVLEFFIRFVTALSDINQAQLSAEPLADPACFGKDLLEARRKRARDGNFYICGRIQHQPGQQSPAARIIRQMVASEV